MTKERAPRKARVDSKESAVKAMIAAKVEITPPDDMKFNAKQLRSFNEIVGEFANVQWTDHSIRLAALLARTVVRMMEDQESLEDEGTVSENARGNPVLNPRSSAIQSAASQIMQMRRTLALHAMAGGAKKSNLGNAGNINKENQANSPLDDDEDLLPTAPTGPMPAPIGRMQ